MYEGLTLVSTISPQQLFTGSSDGLEPCEAAGRCTDAASRPAVGAYTLFAGWARKAKFSHGSVTLP